MGKLSQHCAYFSFQIEQTTQQQEEVSEIEEYEIHLEQMKIEALGKCMI